MIETPFTRGELLELSADDLGDLLRLVERDTVWEAAVVLGLDVRDMTDRHAVERAWWAKGYEPEPYGPVIGADSEGVRSDLTPAVPEDRAPSLPVIDQDLSDLATMDASPEAAMDIAEMMDRSASTGEPFLAGTFAMYAAPDGSVVMVTEGTPPLDGVRRSVVPKRWVRSALQLLAGEGGLKAKMLSKIFG
jgi:hypothetical protein